MESTTETSSDESVVGKKSKPFICTFENCKAAFSKNRKLTNHIRRHTGERPFVCDEAECTKSYTNSSHLRRHKKVFHEKCVERVTCGVEGCHRELANKWCLKKHYNRVHNLERQYPFTCSICNQGFHRKRQLQQHFYLHSGVLPFSCDQCNGKFATTRDCNRHKRTHTKYPCDCGEIFERWTSLLLHRKQCKKKSFSCSVCNKKFSNAANLNSHLATHKDKEEKDVFMCPYENCVRFYFYKKNLMCHINNFHKKVPRPKIPCKFDGCNKLFSKMQNYKLHLMRHSQPKPPKTERKPRKDKGKLRKSTATQLSGITLPLTLEKSIISGQRVDINYELKTNPLNNETEISNITAKVCSNEIQATSVVEENAGNFKEVDTCV